MSKVMYIMRGLPGAGKSTLAQRLVAHESKSHKVVVSADDYFTMPDGAYHFDPARLGAAHGQCQQRAEGACKDGVVVVVDNTNTTRWEMEPYLALARKYEYEVQVVTVETTLSSEDLAARSLHGITAERIQQMRAGWEANWKDGNPIPPWERAPA